MNGADRFFVDSNILLYAHDARNKEKQHRAEFWIQWLWQHAAVLKMPVLAESARRVVSLWSEWHPPEASLGLMPRAWFWTDHASLSFWDALIVSASERNGCCWLLSEDFQAGRQFGAITVVRLNVFQDKTLCPRPIELPPSLFARVEAA
jgi:predicted nucleic acid-binding protein